MGNCAHWAVRRKILIIFLFRNIVLVKICNFSNFFVFLLSIMIVVFIPLTPRCTICSPSTSNSTFPAVCRIKYENVCPVLSFRFRIWLWFSLPFSPQPLRLLCVVSRKLKSYSSKQKTHNNYGTYQEWLFDRPFFFTNVYIRGFSFNCILVLNCCLFSIEITEYMVEPKVHSTLHTSWMELILQIVE